MCYFVPLTIPFNGECQQTTESNMRLSIGGCEPRGVAKGEEVLRRVQGDRERVRLRQGPAEGYELAESVRI